MFEEEIFNEVKNIFESPSSAMNYIDGHYALRQSDNLP